MTARAEEEAIDMALRETGGNRAAAAKRLGISVSTLARKVRGAEAPAATPPDRPKT